MIQGVRKLLVVTVATAAAPAAAERGGAADEVDGLADALEGATFGADGDCRYVGMCAQLKDSEGLRTLCPSTNRSVASTTKLCLLTHSAAWPLLETYFSICQDKIQEPLRLDCGHVFCTECTCCVQISGSIRSE